MKKNALVKIASCMGYFSSSEGLLTCCLPACTVLVNKSCWPPQTCTWDRWGFLHIATHFTLLGCFANYKFRLCAGKWVFPGAVYIRSDKEKGVHQKKLFSHFHAITYQTLFPVDQLNQCPMSLERKKQQQRNWAVCEEEWTWWEARSAQRRSKYTFATIRICLIGFKVRATGCFRSSLTANAGSL